MAPPKKNIFQLSFKSNSVSQRKNRLLKKNWPKSQPSPSTSHTNDATNDFSGDLTDDQSLNENSLTVENENSLMVENQIPPINNVIGNGSSVTQNNNDHSNNLEMILPFQPFNSTPFTEKIRGWAINNNINRTHLNGLLAILKPEIPEVPLSYQTLLETPRDLPVRFFLTFITFMYYVFTYLKYYSI